MNQPYTRVNQPYATLTLASARRKKFGVQLYKNSARALLSLLFHVCDQIALAHLTSLFQKWHFVNDQNYVFLYC